MRLAGIGLAGSVNDTQSLLVQMVNSLAKRPAYYLIATGLPDASVTWLQDFSIAAITPSGMGT